ncbi:MAG: hypothetical protein ISS65_13905 [Desulfobacterales bacterium]|uniref:Uncharacterized protein n=1 Tax=Candidatus Desulfatibia profunda TaxID=2841695 RepID=A0A8J6TK52_9BACT|nr:hypothetical protein [Candidatus Desulfatibia profunda]MBL7181279.1 hypothetical protein [Desulfobacterales bacterium]
MANFIRRVNAHSATLQRPGIYNGFAGPKLFLSAKPMPSPPLFKYYLAPAGQIVPKDDPIWSAPIPMNRKPSPENTAVSISHGDCFSAVRNFLEKDGFNGFVRVLAQHLGRDVTLDEINEIRIFLEKHGEFYHPARIETGLHGISVSFVVNVALPGAGKNKIQNEFRLLQKLRANFPFSYLPKVYGLDRIFLKGGNLEVRMFLGEWFEGFCEFHMSRDPADGTFKIVVWDPEQGNYFLTADQCRELYRKAAAILALYYNIETFEQISSWHHAAGDFVVRCQPGGIDLKLITVRQYGPMFVHSQEETTFDAPDDQTLFDALLVFFLNLSIRMRLDRLDGVGEIVWADTIAVEQTLKGVLEALALKPPVARFKAPLADGFRGYLRSCSRRELYDLNRALVNTYHPRSPDVPVIKKHLKQHADDLYHAIQQQGEFF